MKKGLNKAQLEKTSGGAGISENKIAINKTMDVIRGQVDDAFARGTLEIEKDMIIAAAPFVLLCYRPSQSCISAGLITRKTKDYINQKLASKK